MTGPRSAYVHVPFCVHHCGYCDFAVIAGRDDLVPRYLEALERELQSLDSPVEVDTLFIGGGTPTQLSPTQLRQLLQLLVNWLPTAPHAEVTIEANPHGLTDEHMGVFVEFGGNRVSLGVQSFDDRELRLLERDHRSHEIAHVVDRVRNSVPNLSLDLIFAVPGQSLEGWRQNLQQALELQPTHISCYGLTIEKGTTFWGRTKRGELNVLDEDLQREMYALNMSLLEQHGLVQYELSNFAQPGFESRHNRVYWTGAEFVAFGPGAARLVDGKRQTNHRSVTTWMKRVLTGQSPVAESEQLEPEQRARELAMLNLRMRCGIRFDDFQDRTGFDIRELASDAIRRHESRGWLTSDSEGIRLSYEGRFVADTVMSDFL